MANSLFKKVRIFTSTSSGSGGGGTSITVVTDYAGLPAADSVSGEFRWVSTSTGIYLTGLYYSNGTTWEFNPADDIIVVANYSALPAANTVSGQFYWCSASQGTSWLPGTLGGTYYNSGLYYSNGTTWEFLNVPYQATQAEVDTGTNNDKFVTPSTFTNATQWSTKQDNLVSGTNIKTINSTSLLGSGNNNLVNYSHVFNNIQISLTGTTSEQILNSSMVIPSGTILQNDILKIYALLTANSNANTKTIRMYFNTSHSLSGAILFATNSYTTANSVFVRSMTFQNLLTSIKIWISPNASYNNEEITTFNGTGAILNTLPTFANDVYFIITGQLQNSSDTLYVNELYSQIYRK